VLWSFSGNVNANSFVVLQKVKTVFQPILCLQGEKPHLVTDKEEKKLTVEELLAKAKKPAQLASPMHRFYEGKVQVMPKCALVLYSFG
jgi:hypothetical protein